MKKKVLSAAISASLAMTAAGTAQADALLFPYFEQGNGIYSFLTLGTGGHGGAPDAPNNLHYVWNYTDPALGACTHADARGTMTAFDIIQQTVVDPSLPGGVDLPALFGDVSTPAYLNVSPTEGFMTVEDSLAPEGDFFGQMILVNTVNGTTAALKGMNNPVSTSEDNFASIATSKTSHDVTWYPTATVSTSWYVLVTGTGMSNPAGWKGVRVLDHGHVDPISGAAGGIYDRDENFRSGTRPVTVTCYATLALEDLLTSDQLNGTPADGGFSWLVNTIDADPTTPNGSGTVMIKRESTAALGGMLTTISLENAFPNLPY